jgi:glycerophosphoryl diester phosphodiesterase
VGLQKARRSTLAWVIALVLVLALAAAFLLLARGAPLTPYAWAKHKRLVAHAMGGINGQDYTNSREAWESNYERGYRVFEVDLRVLRDATLVCSHSPVGGMTIGEYEASRTVGGYTPLTVTDLAELMAQYPDAWVMTDMKSGGPAEHDSILKILRSAVSGDATSMSRIIVQAYEEADYRSAHKLGFENIVYTLYRQKSDEWPRSIAFAAENNIRFVALPKETVTKDVVAQARAEHIWVGVHTVNTESERAEYEKLGVTHFYSDYLRP